MIPNADQEEDQLLSTCPRCGYLLRGLPVQHRCPECGLEVDRRWKIFGGRGVSRALIWLNRTVFSLFLGTAVVAILVSIIAGMRPRDWLLFVTTPIVVGWGIWKLVRKPTSFIAVGPEGLVVYREGHSKCYAWTDIRGACLRSSRLTVTTTGGEVHLPWVEYFGDTGGVDAQRCAQAIELEAAQRKEHGG